MTDRQSASTTGKGVPVQRVREQQRLWSLTDLGCEPLGICPDVDHRDRGAGLQPGDKFEKESGSGLCQRRSHVASVRVAHEDSVRRHASQIKPALFLLAGKHIQKRLAQRWVPIALKGHKPAKRYGSSVGKLKSNFGKARLSDISAERIDEYKEARLAEGVEPATINHDLRVLRRMMRLAERKRLVSRNPFVEVEFIKQRHARTPHIVTFEEEEKILAAAPPLIRTLVVLILETGMRSHREALSLMWDAIDFANDSIRVRESKTRAGIRNIPISRRCKVELLRWRDTFGPEFSPFVFPKMRNPNQHLKDVRHSWEKTLKDARLPRFVLYNLRHSYCSRLSAAGVSDLFVAQMIGHSSPSILQIYSKAIDEYRRDAVRKLEEMRAAAHHSWRPSSSASIN